MANLMYAEIAGSIFQGLGNFAVSREEAKLAESRRKYNRTMAALSASVNRNAITSNEIDTRDQTVFARLSIQTAAMQEQADHAVEAAAAGVGGASVRAGATQLTADAARSRTSLERQNLQVRRQFGQQRQQLNLQQIYGRDISPIPRPSFGAALFGMATNAVDIWNEHQPKHRRLGTRLAGQ